jgi:uncharacterized damage-inducible protein DinB
MATGLTCDELLRYVESETAKWEAFFRANPAALDVPLANVAQANSARDLVQHIVAVDLRLSERLRGVELTPFDKITTDVDTLFTTAAKAHASLRDFATVATAHDWSATLDFPKRDGRFNASKRKVFFHTLLHGSRHWAQLAMLLRVAGYKQDWHHDFLMTDAID